MGIYDRAYYQQGRDPYGGPGRGLRGGGGFGGGPGQWSITIWLLIINVAIFVLDVLISQGDPMGGPLTDVGHFSTTTAILHGQIWRFITFQFLHANLWHILFNMIALYFFGPMAEGYLGSRRFLAFYLLSGVGGAALYLALNVAGLMFGEAPVVLSNDPSVRLVGASAGIFGILMAAAYLRPNEVITLLLMFIIPVRMRIKTLAYGLVILALFILFTGGRNAGGEAGHLGGAALGAFLIRKPGLLNWALFGGGKRPGRSFFSPKNGSAKKPGIFEQQRAKKDEKRDQEIDRILAKVGTQGLHSLTASERRLLEKATEEQRRRDAG